MKKLMKLGNVAVETRSNLRGNIPDGAGIVNFNGRCVVLQTALPGAATFTLTTTEPCG